MNKQVKVCDRCGKEIQENERYAETKWNYEKIELAPKEPRKFRLTFNFWHENAPKYLTYKEEYCSADLCEDCALEFMNWMDKDKKENNNDNKRNS